MGTRRCLCCVLLWLGSLLTAVSAGAAGDWHADLGVLLDAAQGSPQQQSALETVLAARPDWRELAEALRSAPVPPAPELQPLGGDAARGGLLLATMPCTDGVGRPYVVYVPTGYSPQRPSPLLVILHGGVSRPALREPQLDYAAGSSFLALAESTQSLAVFPFGQAGCTWWGACGMQMIADELRAVRRQFNVDGNRIAMCGFSDGASAGFLHAMLVPDPYCAFVCLNGHMGVGSLDGGLPTYAPNLANRPTYAVTTFDDPLYPSAALRPTIAMARGCAAGITYRELPGVHEFSYAATELPRIARWLGVHPRDAAPTRIVWEAALPAYGRCDWLELTGVGSSAAASWHNDVNCVLLDESITFGFNNDPDFPGPGIRVASVLPDSAAQRLGLQAGDVITGCATGAVPDMEALAAYKATLRRGAGVQLTVRRGTDSAVQLSGSLSPPESYFLFKRDKPSAAARASYSANRFELQTSRLASVRLWLNPDMIDFDQPLVVVADGREVFSGLVQPDPRIMLEQFLASRDPAALYAARLELELTPVKAE